MLYGRGCGSPAGKQTNRGKSGTVSGNIATVILLIVIEIKNVHKTNKTKKTREKNKDASIEK